MAGITITKIVREHVDLEAHTEGLTYGQLLDKVLEDKARAHEEVQTIEFFNTPEEWHKFASAVVSEKTRKAR